MKIFVNNLKREKLKGELSITFVDDKEMKKMNKKYTKRDSVTDVLSFGFDNTPELMGDIYISVPQAKRQKEGDLLSELKLLTIHGILHLAGYDDGTASERKVMRKKEKYYLNQ
jgi:probable rRNA maturation factor